ncbi:class I SAM-dependent methyltransferase [Streptomyces sp. MI02-7b]|uniref:SAM-dependent methyltransferase n=1 Tax=Streptomyces sp. MI02-7b TaxID=462941 RepID=UPI0029A46EEC|nr:class I SAM-dependent methyltransferase [Streptomyces sp. MI02-7b]MDX3072748.1 class I SAM-dependent methyltransferase [Streptomyces sp. MI02-7b]
MTTPPTPSGAAAGPVLPLDEDPAAVLEAATWAMAAMVGTLHDALTAPLAEVLAADPRRTEVLEEAGLVRREGTAFVPHPSLVPPDGPTARSAVEARLSSMRQALTAATGEGSGGWAALDDRVLLHQGRASAAVGRALGSRIVPQLPGLGDRLAGDGGHILDVGTGVAALALALAEAFPRARVTGIDVLERALDLARGELAEARPGTADRVTLLRRDVADTSERAAYDLVWLPAPFLSEAVLETALPRLADALVPGGWLVAGAGSPSPDGLRRAVGRWNAARNGGSAYDADRMAEVLAARGLQDVRRFPTVPGGPVLVAGRRPQPS